MKLTPSYVILCFLNQSKREVIQEYRHIRSDLNIRNKEKKILHSYIVYFNKLGTLDRILTTD